MPARNRFLAASTCLTASLLGAAGCDSHRTLAPPAQSEKVDWEGQSTPEEWGPGLIVWESNRTGSYRIFLRAFQGGPTRQLTREEPGRDHCCPHLSPDGTRLIYLSLPGGAPAYQPPTTEGELRILRLEDGFEKVVAPNARHYGEHAAAVWWSETALQYIDSDGRSVLVDLARGSRRVLLLGPAEGEGWLIDPSGRWATQGTPSFSRLGPAGELVRATPLGGCQPYFDQEGKFGYWTAGAGGPIDAIDLESRETFTILAKGDPRLPVGQSYLYFPRLSSDRSLLAIGASDGTHDHFQANYDIFVIPLEPHALEPQGQAVRITEHPGVDRFPDLYRAQAPAPKKVVNRPQRTRSHVASSGWPAAEEALVFVWELADRPNRIALNAPSDLLEAQGRASTDRLRRMSLGGGHFEGEQALGRRIVEALRATNTFSLELIAETFSDARSGPIISLASHPGRRSFRLELFRGQARLLLRTSETPPAGSEAVNLGELQHGKPVHLAVTYSPGRLTGFVDGLPVVRTVFPGDFFHWKDGWLLVGAEAASEERFRGAVSHVAIYSRELDPETIRANATRSLQSLQQANDPGFTKVEARLRKRSRIPSLEEISPYRTALVTEQWEVLRHLEGYPVKGSIRIARWAWLNGERSAESREPLGSTVRILRLEPYSAQRQLQPLVLSDTLPPDPSIPYPLGFDVGWSGE